MKNFKEIMIVKSEAKEIDLVLEEEKYIQDKPQFASKAKKTNSKRKVLLKDLMPSQSPRPLDIFKNARIEKSQDQEIIPKNLHFYQEIWRSLNQKLYYPDIFNGLFIQGIASAVIYVKRDGSLSRYMINVDSVSADVEWFIRAVIIKALHKPLNKKFWLEEHKDDEFDELKIKLHFSFEMPISPELVNHYSQGFVNKRELFFLRRVFNPKGNAFGKALPFLGGGGMIDVAYILNSVSGNLKKIYKQNLQNLRRFRLANQAVCSSKRARNSN